MTTSRRRNERHLAATGRLMLARRKFSTGGGRLLPLAFHACKPGHSDGDQAAHKGGREGAKCADTTRLKTQEG